MIRLINQTCKANGVSELPVNEALMNAVQVCSNQRYTLHHSREESKATVDNWSRSPGHFETMIDLRCDCIGVGVIQYDWITYCYIYSAESPTATTSMRNQI